MISFNYTTILHCLPPLQKVVVYWLLTPPMLQAVYSLASGSHLYSGSQTVDYVANLTHNASVLICQVTAANHSHYLVILVNKTYSGLGQTGPVDSRTWQGQERMKIEQPRAQHNQE